RGGMAALQDGAEVVELPVEPEEPPEPAPEQTALSALRHERFRRYSAGVLFSLTGNWVEAAAFGYIVLLLGGSVGTLGLIGFLQLARFIGPAVAGILLAHGGPTWVFAVNAASFLGVLVAVALLPGSMPRASETAERLRGAMAEGLHYVLARRSVASLMALTL